MSPRSLTVAVLALVLLPTGTAEAQRTAPWLELRSDDRTAPARPFPVRPAPTPTPTPRPGGAPDLAGNAEVIDGDTIRIGGASIRIHGIDAPESRQACCTQVGLGYPCGRHATAYMQMLVDGETVSCIQTDTDRYGRVVAICEAAGLELGYQMVWAGWALAYTRFSQDYVDVERDAQTARRGMWAGTFVPPSDWRAGHRSCTLPELTPTPTRTPRPTPRPTVRPTPRPTSRPCCRVCRTGKACGDSCISRSNNCSRPVGCACNG